MTYVLIHHGALATAHAVSGVVPAAEVHRLRSAAELLVRAEALSAGSEAQAAAAREEGRVAGFAAGLSEGRAAAAAEKAVALAELNTAAAAERERLRRDIGRLALEVVRRIAGEIGPEAVVSGLADVALRHLLPDSPVVLRVAPVAAGAVEARSIGRFDAAVAPDAALGLYDCVVETGAGRVHAGLDTQLAALAEAWSARDAA